MQRQDQSDKTRQINRTEGLEFILLIAKKNSYARGRHLVQAFPESNNVSTKVS